MKKLLLLLFLTGCSSGAFHFENDVLLPSKLNSDKYYTNGMALSYVQEDEGQKETFTIGQNIYTPSRKRADGDVAILNRDRLYSGWLYGEYRYTKETSPTLKDTFGIQLGCAGPCSGAKQVQQNFHKLIGQDVPTWRRDFTQKSEPGFIIELERNYLLGATNYSDASIYGSLKGGNIIDSAAVGLHGRFGFNLDKFASEPITFKLPREVPSPYTAYLFVKGEERLVAYNHFLDGSLFHRERHTVSSEPSVQELGVGVTVGYKKFKLTYRFTVFSNEWKERKGNFSFGGVDFQW